MYFWSLFLALILSMFTASQAKAADNAVSLGEVVVTATKTETPLKDVPASVTVITKKDMEATGAKTIPELLRRVPGIFVYSTDGNLLEGHVSLRGFRPYGSERVLILVDGVPWNSEYDGYMNWAKLPPIEDIERIEILRGPASALYGPFAMGGVINIITKKGPTIPQKRLEFAIGSDNERKYYTALEGTSGHLNYHLGVKYWEGDGWREHSNFDRRNFVSKISFSPDDMSNIILGFDYQNTDRLYPGKLTLDEYKEDPKQSIPSNRYSDSGHLESWRTSLVYTKDLSNNQNVKNLFFITHYKYNYPGSSSYLGNINSIGNDLQYNIDHSLFSKNNSLLLGFSFRKEIVDYQSFYKGSLSSDRETKPIFFALYAKNNISLTDKLKFIAGIRYDNVKYEYTNLLNNYKKSKTFDEISPKFGAIYNMNSNIILFANISKAFTPPDVSKLYISKYSNPELSPEKATNYELGIRLIHNKRLYVEISGYYMDVKDEIIKGSDDKYHNAGKTRHKGLETSLNFNINQNLSTFLNFTYQDVKFKDYQDYDGNYCPFVSKYNISWGLTYLNSNGFKFGLDGVFVDKYYVNESNTVRAPSFAVWNARIDYQFKKANFYLKLNNIFDHRYYYMSSSSSVYPYAGRTFMLGIIAKF